MSSVADVDLTVDPVADLPPSAKLVLLTVAEFEPTTQARVRQETDLARGTVHESLTTLREAGLVTRRPDVDTPSRHRYCVR